jgi:hypothetical protein
VEPHHQGRRGVRRLKRRLVIADSVTQLAAADCGCIAVTGSHGGVSAARFALESRPFLSIFNDAGGGKDGAGVAGLSLLQGQGLAACTVAHGSARIGDARSTLEDGIISRANEAARALGVREGQPCRQAVSLANPEGDNS